MTNKKWHQSRTIWANIIAMVIGGLPEMLSLIDINFLKAIGVSDPMKYYSIIALTIGIINIVLRGQTTKPIKRSKKPKISKDESDN